MLTWACICLCMCICALVWDGPTNTIIVTVVGRWGLGHASLMLVCFTSTISDLSCQHGICEIWIKMKFVKLSTRHAEHVAKCQRSVRCWQCNFIRNRELLCKLFPIDAHAPEIGSWIHETISPTSGDWEIGCKTCELAGVEFSSCDAKRHHLMRHHTSNRHRRAVCNLFGYEWESDKSSPCANNFKQLWRTSARHRSGQCLHHK